ncbi:MAG: hypothetical protein NVSMB64_26720 [Candidatus Velthaea sp.]
MRLRVIGDLVPFGGDPFGQPRKLIRIVADEEERRRHVQFGEDVEQQRRFDRIRSVVEGQRHELRISGPVGRRAIVQEAIDPRAEARGKDAMGVGRAHDDGRYHGLRCGMDHAERGDAEQRRAGGE